MKDQLVAGIQRLYPQIYLACHVDHVRTSSTEWRLSARDSSILAHLDRARGVSPKELACHLRVAPSTLSAALGRLGELGYLASRAASADKRQHELRLTNLGARAMAATSVLETKRVRALVALLTPEERAAAARGLDVLAGAARRLQTQS